DPVALARGWSGPVLVVHGDTDSQVTSQDAALLAQAMPHATRLALPSATHMLKPEQPGKPMATYRDPTLPLHPALLPGIIAFIGESTPCS
ncbi:MAG: alpha/beta hydrolase, partial [Pseudomonadota bacterium]